MPTKIAEPLPPPTRKQIVTNQAGWMLMEAGSACGLIPMPVETTFLVGAAFAAAGYLVSEVSDCACEKDPSTHRKTYKQRPPARVAMSLGGAAISALVIGVGASALHSLSATVYSLTSNAQPVTSPEKNRGPERPNAPVNLPVTPNYKP